MRRSYRHMKLRLIYIKLIGINILTLFQEWGSGYPADPITKKFLRDNMDPVFGYPSIVRFSWSTSEKILEEKGFKVNKNTDWIFLRQRKNISMSRSN